MRQNPVDAFHKLVKDATDQRLLSHIYAAAGKFKDADLTFEFSLLPDRRSVFDLSSVTKALVTTPLVFEQILDNKLTLETKVGEWLPPAKLLKLDKRLYEITVLDLLRHTSGLPSWRNFWLNVDEDGEIRWVPLQMVGAFAQSARIGRMQRGLNHAAEGLKPRGTFEYSDVGFLLLGYCLETQFETDIGQLFSRFLKRHLPSFSEPEFGFAPNLDFRNNAVPTSFCKLRERTLAGEVHDENCAALAGISSHAGLFGSGKAVVTYLRQLVKTKVGELLIRKNAELLADPPNDGLAGWRQGSGPSAATFAHGRGLGHLGFTGTGFFISVDAQLKPETFAVLLTNRVFFKRVNPEIVPFRGAAFQILQSSLL